MYPLLENCKKFLVLTIILLIYILSFNIHLQLTLHLLMISIAEVTMPVLHQVIKGGRIWYSTIIWIFLLLYPCATLYLIATTFYWCFVKYFHYLVKNFFFFFYFILLKTLHNMQIKFSCDYNATVWNTIQLREQNINTSMYWVSTNIRVLLAKSIFSKSKF